MDKLEKVDGFIRWRCKWIIFYIPIVNLFRGVRGAQRP